MNKVGNETKIYQALTAGLIKTWQSIQEIK